MAVGPQLAAVLKRYGLESLTDWASQALIQGWSNDQVMLQMWDRPEFRTRFAGIFTRETAGYPPISVDEYLSYENMAQSLASTFGMSLTKQETDTLIGNNVSAREVEDRFQIVASAVYESDTETRGELERLFSITPGNLMRYWMDPKKELPTLQQQYRMGEIAGAALRSGYGELTKAQAQRIQEAGLNREASLTAFGQLKAMSELFSPLDFGENIIDKDTQVEFAAGSADAAQEITKRAERRTAEFSGGGSYAGGQSGFATGSAS